MQTTHTTDRKGASTDKRIRLVDGPKGMDGVSYFVATLERVVERDEISEDRRTIIRHQWQRRRWNGSECLYEYIGSASEPMDAREVEAELPSDPCCDEPYYAPVAPAESACCVEAAPPVRITDTFQMDTGW